MTGHELHVHHTCFKRKIMGEWQHDLSRASCLIPSCGAPLAEYGKVRCMVLFLPPSCCPPE
jgi:hypothetical protein